MPNWKLKDLFWISDGDGDATTATPPAPSPRANDASAVDRMLPMLRDVSGVVGSIAVANAGDILGSDLPRVFDRAALDAMAMRLSQLRAALASAERPMTSATLRYDGHSLYVSQLDCGLLGILAEPHTNEPALEMVARLVGQRLNATVAQR